MRYFKAEVPEDRSLPLPEGHVVAWQDGVVFQCPCGRRTVYVASPPHEISFADDGAVTIKGSVASSPATTERLGYCHIDIKDGNWTMYGDSKCDGAEVRS